MNKKVIETPSFKKAVDIFIFKKKLSTKDFESFKHNLMLNPNKGVLIPGTGGLRKARLKSAFKGKSGSFRVCYFYEVQTASIFLIWIYAKNEHEDIPSEEKKNFRNTIRVIKEGKQ